MGTVSKSLYKLAEDLIYAFNHGPRVRPYAEAIRDKINELWPEEKSPTKPDDEGPCYMVCEWGSLKGLKAAVESYLRLGFRPVGGVAVSGPTADRDEMFYQAMIKDKE